MVSEVDYLNWLEVNKGELVELFAERHEGLFDEFCHELFSNELENLKCEDEELSK